jgi:DNA primase
MMVEDMQSVLERLGMEVVSVRGLEIQSHCPAHEERTGHVDRNPSWWINSDTGAFICFSCQYKGALLSLICSVNNLKTEYGELDFSAAEHWLKESDIDVESTIKRLDKINKLKEQEEDILISNSYLKAYGAPPIGVLKARGITPESALKYEILWDKNKSNWILPIRDPYTNKLLGWQEKGFTGRYFRNFPQGVKKSISLFGFNNYTDGELIVVESPLDCARLHSVGVSTGVATFGALVSKEQLKLIRSAKKIIFAFDNDEAGRKTSSDLLAKTRELGFDAWFFSYSHTTMKDVGAMAKSEILEGLFNSKHSINGIRALI